MCSTTPLIFSKGDSPSVLVPAREIVAFVVRWLEARFPLDGEGPLSARR
jgi:hypothetical protein